MHLKKLALIEESLVVDPRKMLSEINQIPGSLRDKINHLEKKMFKFPQIEIKTTHHFAHGLYAREIFIPKGVVLTGQIHKCEHLNIISKGDISVLTEDGVKRITGHFTMASRPGTKRVGYTHEDTIWTTIHAAPVGEHDIKKLEALFVTDSFDGIPELTEKEISLLKESACLT